MSGDTLDNIEGWSTSYFSSALIGWFAGLGVAAFLIIVTLMFDLDGLDVWELASILPAVIGITIVAGLLVGMPVAALFVALMAAAERVSARARTLPAWLAGGLIATTPLAAIWWIGPLDTDFDPVPLRAVVMPLIMTYAVGLTAAGTAWWVRTRGWKL